VRPADRLDPDVGERFTVSVPAPDIEARIEEMPVDQATCRSAAPGWRAFTGGVEAAVAGKERRLAPTREREALPEHSDPLDNKSVRRGGGRPTGLETPTERRAANDATDRHHAAGHRPELGSPFAVAQACRTTILVATDECDDEDGHGRSGQPVHPHLATPP
jgi:hypothetical protein